MLSRHYDRKIEIYVKTYVSDGYGGQIASDIFVKYVYAKITTNAGNKFVNYGIQDFKNPTIFSVRGKKNGIEYAENYFVKYKNKEFYIKGIQDFSFDGQEINLYCDES